MADNYLSTDNVPGLKKLLRGVRHAGLQAEAFESLKSAEQMRRIIVCERMRSDRGNSSFSLLTFTFLTSCDALKIRALTNILRRRLRATDDAGLLGPRELGLVLPETSAGGAWKVAQDICQLLPDVMRGAKCEVYTYPSHAEPQDTAQEELRKNYSPKTVKARAALRNGNATRRPTTRSAGIGGRAMHSLYVQPLPAWKRFMDVTGAAVGLAVLSPLFALLAVAIKLTSPGPVLFRQWRVGLQGQRFCLYKFRTMVVGAEAMKEQLMALNEVDGPVFKIRRDPRLTRIGTVLRKASLDELPQLWNVLRGEMSLVGPRPPECKEIEAYQPWHRRRLEVTPGLTCIWQVSGRCQVAFDDWVRMDLQYIRSRSVAQDLKLLLKTVPAVVSGRGAS